MKINEILKMSSRESVGKDLEGFYPVFDDHPERQEIIDEYKKTKVWIGNFNANGTNISSMKGGPEKVKGNFQVANNRLTSLDFAPKEVEGDVVLTNNSLKDLKNIHKHFQRIKGRLYFDGNPIKSHVLGVILIKDLTKVNFMPPVVVSSDRYKELKTIEDILNKHLAGDRDIFDCQEELVKAGYKGFAQL